MRLYSRGPSRPARLAEILIDILAALSSQPPCSVALAQWREDTKIDEPETEPLAASPTKEPCPP
jgi:hypothetical protein